MSGRGFKLSIEDLGIRPNIWVWNWAESFRFASGYLKLRYHTGCTNQPRQYRGKCYICFSSFLHQIGLCYIIVILQRSILSHVLSSTENFHTMPLKIPLTEFVFSKVSFFTKRSCSHAFSQESYDEKQQYYYIENKIFEYSHVFAFTILYFCKYTFI